MYCPAPRTGNGVSAPPRRGAPTRPENPPASKTMAPIRSLIISASTFVVDFDVPLIKYWIYIPRFHLSVVRKIIIISFIGTNMFVRWMTHSYADIRRYSYMSVNNVLLQVNKELCKCTRMFDLPSIGNFSISFSVRGQAFMCKSNCGVGGTVLSQLELWNWHLDLEVQLESLRQTLEDKGLRN